MGKTCGLKLVFRKRIAGVYTTYKNNAPFTFMMHMYAVEGHGRTGKDTDHRGMDRQLNNTFNRFKADYDKPSSHRDCAKDDLFFHGDYWSVLDLHHDSHN